MNITQPILIAGGAGFVGSALVRDLLQRGHEIISFDNYKFGRPAALKGLNRPVRAIEGDIRDTRSLTAVLGHHRVKTIVNCVGDTFVPDAYEDPGRCFDINLMGCLSVLTAARNNGVEKVLYVSSTEVYGDVGESKLNEDQALAPVNTYAVSKMAADRLCYTFWIEHGLPVIIARIFNCYGPRATHPYVIPEIIRQLHAGDLLQLGNIQAKRDFTYVEDTARGLSAILASSIAPGEIVHIGTGSTISIEELVRMTARIMGKPEPRIEQDPARLRRRDIGCFRCDATKLRNTTDWRPEISMEEGLARTIRWFHQNGDRWYWEEDHHQRESVMTLTSHPVP